MNDPQNPKPLSPWLDEPEIDEAASDSSPEGAWHWCRRNPISTSLMAVGTVSLIVGMAVMFYFAVTASDRRRARAVRPVRPATTQEKPALPGPPLAEPMSMSPANSPERPQTASRNGGDLDLSRVLPPRKITPSTPAFVRRTLWPIAEQGRVEGHYWGASFSPNGQTYLVYGDSGPRGVVHLWDLTTGKLLQEFRTDKDVWFFNACFLPDGEQLVTAYSNDKNVYLWDVATGRVVHEFQGHTADGVAGFASHDGATLVSSGKDNSLRLWDVAKLQEVWNQDVSGEQIARVVFSPDDKMILTSGAEGVLRIRDLKTGTVVGRLVGHSAPCAGNFSPDGKQALSWGEDGQIRLWDISKAETLHSFEGRSVGARQAWHLDDGRQVLTWGKDLVFRVWDAGTGAKLREITVADMIPPGWTEAVVSPDDQRLLVVNSDGDDVRLMDIDSGSEIYRSERGQLPKARGFAFSPDGRHVAAGSFRTGVYLIEFPVLSAESDSFPAGK